MGSDVTINGLSDSRGAAPDTQSRRPRLAAQVAGEIEELILTKKWPVGFQIGREATLAEQLGVSRWTLREAVRILEASGLVGSRKGGGGGLFVASNAHDFVCRTVSNYFEYIHIGVREFAAVSEALGRHALERTLKDLTSADRDAIEKRLATFEGLPVARQLEEAGNLHQLLMEKCGNPAVMLFLGALSQMTFNAAIYSDLDDAGWYSTMASVIDLVKETAHGVLAGDGQHAQGSADQVTRLYVKLFEHSQIQLRKPITADATDRAYNFFPPSRPTKKADHIERAIREMIFDQALPAGTKLGSGKELLERFQVGRFVLGEALRSLEQLGVIETNWGGRGGLWVVSPDPAKVVAACCRQLRREHLRRQQITPVKAMLTTLSRSIEGPTPVIDLFQWVLRNV